MVLLADTVQTWRSKISNPEPHGLQKTFTKAKTKFTHFSFISRHQVSNSIESPWRKTKQRKTKEHSYIKEAAYLVNDVVWLVLQMCKTMINPKAQFLQNKKTGCRFFVCLFFYLWCLQRDLNTHGAPDAWKLASQCLFGFMGNLWDVFDGQIKLEGILTWISIIHAMKRSTVNLKAKQSWQRMTTLFYPVRSSRRWWRASADLLSQPGLDYHLDSLQIQKQAAQTMSWFYRNNP